MNHYGTEAIAMFYNRHPEFLGNREKAIIYGKKSYVESYALGREPYPGCYLVINPEIDGDNTCVIAWDRKGYKRGTIVN